MRTRWLFTLALALLALGLGLWVYLMPRSEDRSSFAISELPAHAVERIRVERTGESPIVLVRTGESWRVAEPLRAAADPAEVNRLLAVLAARAPQRMAPVELARFDLDRAPLRLTFNEQPIDFGMVSAVGREQYVLAGGAIYVIDPKYTVHIPRAAIQFVSRQLLPGDANIVSLRFPAFTVTQEAGAWQLSPSPGKASADDLSRFVERWRHARAQRVEPAGEGSAQGDVAVHLANGRITRFGIAKRGDEMILRDATSALDYLFPAAAAQHLLTQPGSAAQR
jgi:hypothetical protein